MSVNETRDTRLRASRGRPPPPDLDRHPRLQRGGDPPRGGHRSARAPRAVRLARTRSSWPRTARATSTVGDRAGARRTSTRRSASSRSASPTTAGALRRASPAPGRVRHLRRDRSLRHRLPPPRVELLDTGESDMVIGSKLIAGRAGRAPRAPPRGEPALQRSAARHARLRGHRHARTEGLPCASACCRSPRRAWSTKMCSRASS